MKRDKNLAYRILKMCQQIQSGLEDFQLGLFVNRPEFSDVDQCYLLDHYLLLGDAGCFVDYNLDGKSYHELASIPPSNFILSWKGHDLLDELEFGIEERFRIK